MTPRGFFFILPPSAFRLPPFSSGGLIYREGSDMSMYARGAKQATHESHETVPRREIGLKKTQKTQKELNAEG